MTRRLFLLIIAFLAVILSAGIVYVDRFGELPAETFLREKNKIISIVSPYKELNDQLLKNISLLKSFKADGEISGDLRGFFNGLKSFQSQNSLAADFSNDKNIRLHWLSDLVLKTLTNNNHFLKFELRRIGPDDFFIKSSKAKIDPMVKSIVGPLLEKWISVDANISKNLTPPEEQLNLGFTEEQFIGEIRRAIQQTAIITLTRKLSGEEHYQFIVSPVNLTQFLGLLIGNLSGQPFSEEEFVNLFQALYQYRIDGEIWLDPIKNLPAELIVNWNSWLNFHFRLKDFDEKVTIEKPPKAESLEKLIR